MTSRSGERVLYALLALLGLAEAVAVYLWNPTGRAVFFQLYYALATAAVVLRLSRPRSPRPAPGFATGAVVAGTFVVTLLLAQFSLQAFPNSGDEYGYRYITDTLMHGRLWNPAYPEPLRDVLQTFYIGGRGSQRVSQYLPGWPVVLMPFAWAGIPQFANAVVGLIAATFMILALNCLAIPRSVRLAALALGIAAPFTLFNDASFFSHPLTAAALLGIIWLDLRDAARPTAWNRVGLGVGFSVLLVTRYEAGLLCLALFAIDGLWRRRFRFVAWALPIAAGALPLTLLLLAYNWRITGSPFTTTIAWVSPGIGFGLGAAGQDGPHSAERGLLHTIAWLASWQDFASVLLLPLYLIALWHRMGARTVRWFDLLWPAVVGLFFFFPDNGGFQYGPRYWYVAHAAMPLTVAAGLPVAGDLWRIGRQHLDPWRLATAQMAGFAGFMIGFAVFLYIQTENRLAPSRLAASVAAPAMVLMADADRRYVAWQEHPYRLLAKDYTRNGVGGLGPIVIAIDLGDERTALLCTQVPERAIYRMRLDPVGPGGSLVPVCNGATDPPTSKGS